MRFIPVLRGFWIDRGISMEFAQLESRFEWWALASDNVDILLLILVGNCQLLTALIAIHVKLGYRRLLWRYCIELWIVRVTPVRTWTQKVNVVDVVMLMNNRELATGINTYFKL